MATYKFPEIQAEDDLYSTSYCLDDTEKCVKSIIELAGTDEVKTKGYAQYLFEEYYPAYIGCVDYYLITGEHTPVDKTNLHKLLTKYVSEAIECIKNFRNLKQINLIL